jgi:predicted ABC-type ATPase
MRLKIIEIVTVRNGSGSQTVVHFIPVNAQGTNVMADADAAQRRWSVNASELAGEMLEVGAEFELRRVN